MASAMAEVVEDSEDMLARLLGGAARLGKEREGQDQIALIPCRKVRLRQLAMLSMERGPIFIGQLLLLYMAVITWIGNKSQSLNMAGLILIDCPA
ncbi:hypothetical protein GUJ93_ZPchr0010g10464 [Zizania palustris]|uniref:Uncharacterized protein n=1 Tax=Zizania palustris TaxID=103762 RepID=A0A8J5WCT5_ZIZPA|nr:hypothetical protein GUJ93_ZPchr0010g10464 [Zizania palustris]